MEPNVFLSFPSLLTNVSEVVVGSSLAVFAITDLNNVLQLDELLTQCFDHALEVNLVLVVLVNHIYTTLLVVPFYIRLKSDLLASLVTGEEWKIG